MHFFPPPSWDLYMGFNSAFKGLINCLCYNRPALCRQTKLPKKIKFFKPHSWIENKSTNQARSTFMPYYWWTLVVQAQIQYASTGVQNIPNIRSHLKILSTKKVTWRKFCTKDQQIFGTTLQNCQPGKLAPGICAPLDQCIFYDHMSQSKHTLNN